MPLIATMVDTPNYVLLEANRRIGPDIVPLHAGTECVPIYGFSNKGPYDRFCTNSPLPLTPYPLVKFYLENQVAVGDGIKLVVIDAAGPRDPHLHAATMEAVLEAREIRASQMTATYRLTFDPEAGAYRVEEASV